MKSLQEQGSTTCEPQPYADPVQALLDERAEDYLRSCVRFAKAWQLSEDPVVGIFALTDALEFTKEAQRHLERRVQESPRYFWRGSSNPADQAAAILDKTLCGNPRCECQKHKATHCPAHQDEHPSLSVSVKGDKLLLFCHAGCSQASVISALQAMGLWSGPRPVRGLPI
jgi:hypothetical protein